MAAGGAQTGSDLQMKLQTLSEDYQNLQNDLNSSVTARQKLESQQQENLSVQKEFKSLDSESNIYKLVGPVLLKQDKHDAMMAVEGRLEFIGGEIKRREQQIKEIQEKTDKVKMEIYQIQSQAQQQQQGAAEQQGKVAA